MFAGFDVNVDLEAYKGYAAYGREIHDENKKIVETKLDSFKDLNGKLIGDKIVADWFPPIIDADIFLSHSHKDEEGIVGLSGWLHKEFGVRCFIDSCIWGYSAKLLRMIDDEYCYDSVREIYNYSERNRSTSHVHMMLSTALSNAMDSCECVFFVNTPNSIQADEFIKGSSTTESPWIFSEIAMTKLIRRRAAKDHRRMIAEAMDSVTGMESLEKSLNIRYGVNLSHLVHITQEDLVFWQGLQSARKILHPLDYLYDAKL